MSATQGLLLSVAGDIAVASVGCPIWSVNCRQEVMKNPAAGLESVHTLGVDHRQGHACRQRETVFWG